MAENRIWPGTQLPNYNPNLTTTLDANVEKWYNKTLLENSVPYLVHEQFADKTMLPTGNGKTVQWRRFNPLPRAIDPLEEGVVPDGQFAERTEVLATIKQYGKYMSFSDLISMVDIDPLINEYIAELANQGMLSIDTIVRDAIYEDAVNVMYAGTGHTNIGQITAADKLTTVEIRKAVRALKRNLAPMFTRSGKPHYVAIINPETEYDLQDDPQWQAVAHYQEKEHIYSGEIGRLFGVVFVTSTESKFFAAPTIPSDITVASFASPIVTLSGPIDLEAVYAISTNKKVKIGAATYTVTDATATTITVDPAAGTPADGDAVVGVGPGADGVNVASTIVFGRGAYGTVGLGSNGSNLHSVVKPLGSAGTADPLDQISTVGWKINGFAAKMLHPERLIQIIHGVSQ